MSNKEVILLEQLKGTCYEFINCYYMGIISEKQLCDICYGILSEYKQHLKLSKEAIKAMDDWLYVNVWVFNCQPFK